MIYSTRLNEYTGEMFIKCERSSVSKHSPTRTLKQHQMCLASSVFRLAGGRWQSHGNNKENY